MKQKKQIRHHQKPKCTFKTLFDVIIKKNQLSDDAVIYISKIKKFLSHFETEMQKLGWVQSKYFSKLSHSDFKKKIYAILGRLDSCQRQEFAKYVNRDRLGLISEENYNGTHFLVIYNKIRSIFKKRKSKKTKTKRITKGMNRTQKKKVTSLSQIITNKNSPHVQQEQQRPERTQSRPIMAQQSRRSKPESKSKINHSKPPKIPNKETLQHYLKKINLKQKQNLELDINIPKCPLKCANFMEVRKCMDAHHYFVACSSCAWHYHRCIKEFSQQFNDYVNQKDYTRFDEINITTNGQIIEQKIKALAGTNSKNNLQDYLDCLGYKYIDHFNYLPETPNFECNYPLLNSSTAQNIIKNRQQEMYLPLQIKQSVIKGAGLGVFATQKISEGVIVCSYLGEVGISSMIPSHRAVHIKGKKLKKMQPNDSIFTLGWLDNSALLVAPNKYSNVGRFINYEEKSKCNLKANIGLMKVKKKFIQPVIFLQSTRIINQGEELYYSYGSDYNLQDLK